MIEIFYSDFDSSFGKIWLLGTDRGLFSVYLRNIDEEQLVKTIEASDKEIFSLGRNDKYLKDVVGQIDLYLQGKPADFNFQLDLVGATQFQLDVWYAVKQIPAGETRTYGWLAKEIGRPKAFRAVGNALGANPLPIIIPCHRIVATKGLGGFTGGLQWKQSLLTLEGHTLE